MFVKSYKEKNCIPRFLSDYSKTWGFIYKLVNEIETTSQGCTKGKTEYIMGKRAGEKM